MTLRIRLSAIFFMLIVTPLLGFAQEAAPVPTEPVKPPRIPVTTTIGVQVSGTDVQYAKVLYAGLSVQQARGPDNWYLRGYYYGSYAPTYDGYITRLDYRNENVKIKGRYDVWTGILSEYNYTDPIGYYFLSYGTGKQFDARNKGEIGIGMLSVYNSSEGDKPAVSFSITGSKPISKNLTFDARILALQPVDKLSDTKLDSDLGLSYALTQGLSLRLGWTANNFAQNLYIAGEKWTSNVQLMISFNKTTTR